MPLSPEHAKVLETIQTEWNQAEEDVKLAEQVCKDIVVPAIKELRYGGRRVVDMIHLVLTGGSVKEIDALLADATFDCQRARHDAIDAATAKIALDLDIMIDKIKYEAILAAYPAFTQLFTALEDVREKIAHSRNRRQDRLAIYAVIETVDFPALVKSYVEMRKCEAIMISLAKRNRRRDFYGQWGFWIGGAAFVLAIATVLIA